MSAVSLQRFTVSCKDFGEYRIIVEAADAASAVKTAKRLYFINSLGDDELEPLSTFAHGWKVQPLVAEVRL
jgi:hypothetical protein